MRVDLPSDELTIVTEDIDDPHLGVFVGYVVLHPNVVVNG